MHFNFFCTMITKNCSRLTCQLIPWCKLNGLIECSALNVRNLEIWEFLILVVFLKLVKGFCSPWCDHMFCAIRFEFGFVLRFELFLFCFTKHRLLVKHECCGSNDFQDYFDDFKHRWACERGRKTHSILSVHDWNWYGRWFMLWWTWESRNEQHHRFTSCTRKE